MPKNAAGRDRMTSRQRMLAAIHHERMDRVPVAPWGLGRLDPDGALAAELIARTDPWLEVGLGCDAVGGDAFPIEETRTGNLLRRTIHAPGRDLHATWTTTAQTTACTEPFCKSIDDIEALRHILRHLWRGRRPQFHRFGGCGQKVRVICTSCAGGADASR